VEITASLDPATKRRVQCKMIVTAATVALILILLGEMLRALLHFTIASLPIAGGVILLVLAVCMVLGQPSGGHSTAGKDPMRLAQFTPGRAGPWPCTSRPRCRDEVAGQVDGEGVQRVGEAERVPHRDQLDQLVPLLVG
jgi:MarC family integral membrane protein